MIQINVELDEEIKQYQFPTDWSEVSVEQFTSLYTIDTNIHQGMFYTFEVLHKLTGIEREIIEQIDYEDFKELVKNLDFIYEPIKEENKESIIVNGEEYFLHTEFSKYKAGEIITVETLLQSVDGDVNKVMSKLLCVFLRKKDKKGNLESFKTTFLGREESFKKIKISDINHIFTFFLTGRDLSLNNMMDSSKNNEN